MIQGQFKNHSVAKPKVAESRREERREGALITPNVWTQ